MIACLKFNRRLNPCTISLASFNKFINKGLKKNEEFT